MQSYTHNIPFLNLQDPQDWIYGPSLYVQHVEAMARAQRSGVELLYGVGVGLGSSALLFSHTRPLTAGTSSLSLYPGFEPLFSLACARFGALSGFHGSVVGFALASSRVLSDLCIGTKFFVRVL